MTLETGTTVQFTELRVTTVMSQGSDAIAALFSATLTENTTSISIGSIRSYVSELSQLGEFSVVFTETDQADAVGFQPGGQHICTLIAGNTLLVAVFFLHNILIFSNTAISIIRHCYVDATFIRVNKPATSTSSRYCAAVSALSRYASLRSFVRFREYYVDSQ